MPSHHTASKGRLSAERGAIPSSRSEENYEGDGEVKLGILWKMHRIPRPHWPSPKVLAELLSGH